MEREQTTIQIGLRTPEALSERLDKKAEELGISKNALILVLIDLGFKTYESEIRHLPPQE